MNFPFERAMLCGLNMYHRRGREFYNVSASSPKKIVFLGGKIKLLRPTPEFFVLSSPHNKRSLLQRSQKLDCILRRLSATRRYQKEPAISQGFSIVSSKGGLSLIIEVLRNCKSQIYFLIINVLFLSAFSFHFFLFFCRYKVRGVTSSYNNFNIITVLYAFLHVLILLFFLSSFFSYFSQIFFCL